MSVRNEDGIKILLGRGGPDEFWSPVIEHYASGEPQRWKLLAMLALRENAGWPLDRIGVALGHTKGHVGRCLNQIKNELRDQFDQAPEFLEPTDQLDEDD